MRIAMLVSGLFWTFIIVYCTGCMAIAGVKSYDTGTKADGSTYSRWAFTQGIDVGFSANAVDDVSNKRGISPTFTGDSETQTGGSRHGKY